MMRRPLPHQILSLVHRHILRRSRALLAITMIGLFGVTAGVTPVTAAPLAQFVSLNTPSVTVNGQGEASVPAETATVQFLVVPADLFEDGMMGDVPMEPVDSMTGATPVAAPANGQPTDSAIPGTVTAAQLAPIAEAIATAAGVEPDAVQITLSPLNTSLFIGETGNARLDLEVDQPTTEGINVLMAAASQAAAANDLLIQSGGVFYHVADCSQVEEAAQQAALDDARARAERLARLLGVSLGEVSGAMTADYFDPLTDGCQGQNVPYIDSGYGGLALSVPNFDPSQPAEVEVYSTVSISYEIVHD